MRKTAVLLALLAVVLMATPAPAVHRGTVCKSFQGPDGPAWGAQFTQCININEHDWTSEIQAWMNSKNRSNETRVDVHVSYLQLVKEGVGVVRERGPFTSRLQPGDDVFFTGNWYGRPEGAFHTRIRMWACFIDFPGDPCTAVTTWNSNTANY